MCSIKIHYCQAQQLRIMITLATYIAGNKTNVTVKKCRGLGFAL
jgi:hypothetical protein